MLRLSIVPITTTRIWSGAHPIGLYQADTSQLPRALFALPRALLILILGCPHYGATQYPPPLADDSLQVIKSPVDGNITISFKSPPVGTCTTLFETQRQYTGYITLPPNILQPSQGNYTINTFFWFIEARQLPQTAPLTIYINGGPGSSSMVGLFQEVGPCQVVEISQQKLGTVARDWGWDRSSNIVFIDQPVQVGFSYDQMTNASLNLLDETMTYPPTTVPITQPSYTFLNGTFGSGNSTATSITSQIAAQAVWHFLQGFLSTFPQYNPALQPNGTITEGSVGINLFTESYGGKYGPAIGTFFQQQNSLRDSDPSFANLTLSVNLRSLGIINGWIDSPTQTPFHPKFAYNNTYGIQAISQVQELDALSSYSGAGGCQQLTATCRAQEIAYDPESSGSVPMVNDACSQAQYACQYYVTGPYTTSGRSVYDISQNMYDPFPDSHYLEYLNTPEVQQAIGVPVNYTQDSLAVYLAFNETGDYVRDTMLQDLVDLLNAGTRVALIYGDRDYICNWFGGEAVSFGIAGLAGASYSPFYAAGYAPVVANSSYIGGVVREYGNLSFSRIYDAGHLVPAYQPETAFTMFSRIIDGTSISLGESVDLSTSGSFGDANSTYQSIAPPAADPVCFVRAANTTCNTDAKNMLANDAGVIINGVLYADASDWKPPSPSISSMAGMPGTAPASMISSVPESSHPRSTKKGSRKTSSLPTGVFTATGVPYTASTSSGGASPRATNFILQDTQPAAAMMALGLLML